MLPNGPNKWTLANIRARVDLAIPNPAAPEIASWRPGSLATVKGDWDGQLLKVYELEIFHAPPHEHVTPNTRRFDAAVARDRATHAVRDFFERHKFLEVNTPCWVPEPGTDVYLEAFKALFVPEALVEQTHRSQTHDRVTPHGLIQGYLHTSPEFAMKRLLSEGFERIWQLTPVWRNGEVSPTHSPEFSMLEWYRAWEDVDAIIEDTQELTRSVLGDSALVWRDGTRHEYILPERFERVTMQQLVEEACGFDILAAERFDELLEQARSRDLTSMFAPGQALPRTDRREDLWHELFAELQVMYIEPQLARMGPVFLTDWPASLAVLAARDPSDPRVAKRFELYIGGVELANGFQELTDPVEQRARFEEDTQRRRRLGRPPYPMPERFLRALELGMPPSSGVAVGFDRLVMLAAGSNEIDQINPFSLTRDKGTGEIYWGN